MNHHWAKISRGQGVATVPFSTANSPAYHSALRSWAIDCPTHEQSVLAYTTPLLAGEEEWTKFEEMSPGRLTVQLSLRDHSL